MTKPGLARYDACSARTLEFLMRSTPLILGLTLTAATAGCAATGEGTTECRIGSDCPSGACEQGQCVEPSSSNSGGTGGDGGGGSSGGGGLGGSGGEGAAMGGAPPGCGNADGVLAQDELFLEPGLSAQLRAAQGVTFDTAGSEDVDGSRTWDLSVTLSGDHGLVVATLPLAGTWYESSYPGASYAARLADSAELLGIFEVGTDALRLRGVVSPDPGITRTELTYDPPVLVVDFPVSEGKSWTTTSTVTGLAQGVAVFYTEAYAFDVDARGTAITPLGEFDVLRVHSELVRTVGGFPTTIQSHNFMAECFGSVAAITSEDHELEREFTAAAEVRRLSP
ncbi:MAG: hypothetical protein R3B72_31750 [Polyangiaceae bacterium]